MAHRLLTAITGVSSLALSLAAQADAAETGAGPKAQPSRQAYFGDLHLHTAFSFDAYVFLETRITPNEAYRFARGQPVTYLGDTIKRKEPLDFLAVTDHSESMGVLNELDDPNSPLSKSELGKKIRANGPGNFMELVTQVISGKSLGGVDTAAVTRSAWQKEIDAANANYEPGKFTTLIAYEWSSSPGGQNLHRNVFFRGDTAPLPFSSVDSNKPEDLWSYLEKNRSQGIEALSISHNGNASNGLMYDWKDSAGKPIDEAYAQRRALNEPLTEISQGKGASETHPSLSPNDEFANFEIFDHLLVSVQKSEVHGSYVRDAYGRGLFIGQQTGSNPFKFGVVGASDYHNGLSTSTEDAYGGTLAGLDAANLRSEADKSQQKIAASDLFNGKNVLLDTSPGNLTGVWAERNTRGSIYDALRRKETFATSGTKIKVRFFGGWDFDPKLLSQANWVETAYTHGTPMGGDLPAKAPAAGAPRFAVWALKDPNAANLDRAQIVKVWLEGGRYREKVFDIALSGGRQVDSKSGKAPLVGSTVDLKTATYKNTIGAAQFATVWQDPQFDPLQPAVYYLRVLEIPTPRWSTILAIKQGHALPEGVPATVQERAWASPVWYTPAVGASARAALPKS